MWHAGRATARQLLARGCHDNRQTDANETPSPSISNGCRGSYWPLCCQNLAPLLVLTSLALVLRWQAAVPGPPDGLDWLPEAGLETDADAACGCNEAPRETASPTVQRGPRSGRGREMSSTLRLLLQVIYTVK